MKTILVATDYSPASLNALKFACSLRKKMNSRLVVTHVFDVPTILGTQLAEPFPHLKNDTFSHEKERLIEYFETEIGSLSEEQCIRIEPVENKSAVSGIISKATDWHAQLILAGMKGENLWKDMVIGSTAKRLIEIAPCPVLNIPAEASYRDFKTIVYASAFENEDIHAIERLIEMVRPLKAEIRVVHVSTDDEYPGEAQMEWFKDMLNQRTSYPYLYFDIIHDSHITDSLKVYTDNLRASLIVMLKRKDTSLLPAWMHKDHVKKMAVNSRIPVLSYNEKHLQTLFY